MARQTQRISDYERPNGSTYVKEQVTDSKRTVRWEIGDAQQARFFPQFKSLHWNNETNFSIRLIDAAYQDGVVTTDANGRLEWHRGNRIARWYEQPSSFEDGEFEFEVDLLSQPASTTVAEFSVQGKGVRLTYLPPKVGWIREFDAASNEWCLNSPDGLFGRFEKANGSIDVSHASRANNFTDKHYRTGKMFQIWRPWAEDAIGVRVWCDLALTQQGVGEYTIQIIAPRAFLVAATYPVRVDPTFGYTTAGTDYLSTAADRAWASRFALSESANVTKLTASVGNGGGTVNAKGLIYDDSVAGAPPNARQLVAAAFAIPTSQSWVDSAGTVSLSAANFYLGIVADGAARLYATDFTSGEFLSQKNGLGYTSPLDPWGTSTADYTAYRSSIYATYDIPAGGRVPSLTLIGVGRCTALPIALLEWLRHRKNSVANEGHH